MIARPPASSTDVRFRTAHLPRDEAPAVGPATVWDPLGFDAGDANLYRYVRNNPVTLTDPLGLDSTREKFTKLFKVYLGNDTAKYDQINYEMTDLLTDKDPKVVKEARDALLANLKGLPAAKAPEQKEVKNIDDYISKLKSNRFPVRNQAKESLVKLGGRAKKALECALAEATKRKNPVLDFTRQLTSALSEIKKNQKIEEAIAANFDRLLDPNIPPLKAFEDRQFRMDIREQLQRLSQGDPEAPLTKSAKALLKEYNQLIDKKD